MKESTLLKMQKEIKDLQEFVVMMHFQLKELTKKNGKTESKS
tara:strand:- start:3518 stop:3643 length:126 start_codon:yes stop_codon:yes gene_type:complete